MLNSIDQFYAKQDEPNQSCLLALRKFILEYNTNLKEDWKYGMPCFCLQKKAICYLWKDKKTNEPYVLLVDGGLMKHPSLIQGNRARMKILPISPTTDLPVEVLNEVLEEALKLRRSLSKKK